jgi:hypothetical protein
MENFRSGYPDEEIKLPSDAPVTCNRCFCLVRIKDCENHAEWHEKLRRAVDETDMLS